MVMSREGILGKALGSQYKKRLHNSASVGGVGWVYHSDSQFLTWSEQLHIHAKKVPHD